MPVKWMSKNKCLRLLRRAKYGHLATSDKNNQPYITPINFVLIGQHIYFHTGFSGQKLENLISNPKVCFEISRLGKLYSAKQAKKFTYRFWSVLVTGRAVPITDDKIKLTVMNKLMEKYASTHTYVPLSLQDMPDVNVIEITIDKISGKLSIDPTTS